MRRAKCQTGIPCSTATKPPRVKRRSSIAALLEAGRTLAEIGAVLGFSGEYARQLIAGDPALVGIIRRVRRKAKARKLRRLEAASAKTARRERARKARRNTIASMLAEGCSFVEIGAALGVNYKGPLYTTRHDPELQAIYDAAAGLRKARTRGKMSVAHKRPGAAQ